MKKIAYMFVAALGLVSCSQDEMIENSTSSNAIFASLEENSRVAIDEKLYLSWEKNDKFIAFQSYTLQGQGKVTTGTAYELEPTYAKSKTGMFNPADGQAADYAPAYAIYPAQLNPKYNGDGSIIEKTDWDTMEKYKADGGDGTYTITLPDGNNNLGLDAPMFGNVLNEKVTFRLVTGMLKINLAQTTLDIANVKEVTVTTKDIALAGDTKIATIEGKWGAKYIVAEPIAKAGSNVMTIPAKCAIDNIYYIPAPQAIYPEIKVSVSDGTKVEERTFTNADIKFGTMYNVFKK